MAESIVRLLNAYRRIDWAAAEFAAEVPNTPKWLRAKYELEAARSRINLLETELAPVGSPYHRGSDFKPPGGYGR